MLLYLARTLDIGIKYKKSTGDGINSLVGYSDSEEHHPIPIAYNWITNCEEIEIVHGILGEVRFAEKTIALFCET